MLEATHKLIISAADVIGMNNDEVAALMHIDHEYKFAIKLKDGREFPAYRVQHNNRRGAYKGGIRFHANVTLDEIQALSTLMSLKTAVAGLPLGGAKGGVSVNPRELSTEELEFVSRNYVRQLHEHIGPDVDIPAPDVNTDPRIIDWMSDEYAKLTGDRSGASFTGKSLGHGGIAGRDRATGLGGSIVLDELLKHAGKEKEQLTFAIQGFGNVGSYFALALESHPQWKLIAVSDSSTGLCNPWGLQPEQLFDFKKDRRSFLEFPPDHTQKITNEQLLALDVDILVLAALEDVITAENVDTIKARHILELANGPISHSAIGKLREKGIVVIPDILANAGGVTVSYFEWLQNRSGSMWTEEKVLDTLTDYLIAATRAVIEIADRYGVPIDQAAIIKGMLELNESQSGPKKLNYRHRRQHEADADPQRTAHK